MASDPERKLRTFPCAAYLQPKADILTRVLKKGDGREQGATGVFHCSFVLLLMFSLMCQALELASLDVCEVWRIETTNTGRSMLVPALRDIIFRSSHSKGSKADLIYNEARRPETGPLWKQPSVVK